MKRNVVIIFLSGLFFILSCSRVTDPQGPYKLYVHFQDENNKQIENVGLHFFVDFNQPHGKKSGFPKTEMAWQDSVIHNSDSSDYHLFQNFPNPFNASARINVALPKTVDASLKITDKDDSTRVIRTLFDGRLQAGMHSVQWDGRNENGDYVSNNIYRYEFVSDEFRDIKRLFVNRIDPQKIRTLNCLPLSRSDKNGNIEMDYSVFPIDEEIPWLDEKGSEQALLPISSSIHLVFIKEGYLTKTKAVTLPENNSLELTVTLVKE